MNRRLSGALKSAFVVAAVWGTSAPARAADWVQASPDGAFHVSTPKRMDRREETRAQPWGEQKAVIHSVTFGFGSYAVVYSDLPMPFVEKATSERLLLAQQRNVMPTTRAELVGQQKIQKQGHPGREVEFVSDNGRQLTIAQVFIAGGRLFSVIATTRRPGHPEADIRRFLNSFKIL